jgi:hypothetical protein
MAFVSASFSNRKLQDRRFTVPISLAGGTIGLSDSQEAFTSTLAISSDEIFTDDRYIPSSSLPFSGSSQNNYILSASFTNPSLSGFGDLPILKFWYRKKLTPGSTTSATNNKKETWFFLTGSLSEVSEQIIDISQVTDFISPKFGTPEISGYYTENNPPGYNITVYTSSVAAPSVPSDYYLVVPAKYTFDYKTGVLIFNSNADAPTNTQYVWVTAYQYVGRTLRSQIEDNSIGGGGSGFPFTGSAVITGSLLISGSGTINELVVSGNVIATQGFTGSLFGTASWANNVISASHGVTASYVNNLNQNLSITGAVILSGSSLPELRVIGETQFTGSVFISGGFDAQGISGSRAYLGTHIVGAVGVTGSGLIINSSNLPSNHHNFVKIGNTELVDYNLGSAANRFFINNVDEFYVRSGGLNDGGDILTNTSLLLEHKEGTFKAYSSNNTTPLTVSSASAIITSNTTAIKAAETTNLNYLLAFDSNPSSTAQSIGWVLPSRFITSTGSSAGQVISGSGSVPTLTIIGATGSAIALAVTGGLSVSGGITGSLLGTASWANNVISASHGVTASYVNTLNQNVSINGTLTVSNTTTLNGDLLVYGSASFFGSSSFINVQNLAIEDKFILLNSGSKGTPSHEGGIIIQTSASTDNAFGTAIFYDQDTNRWMVARSSSVAANATSITVGATTDYIVTVTASTSEPSASSFPSNFGLGNNNVSVGQMYINTNNGNIYIYA